MIYDSYPVTAKDGLQLFVRVWKAQTKEKAVIFLLHGFSEHSGRYTTWAERFAENNISIYAIDYRGHGKAGGIRGHTPSYKHLLDDIDVLIQQADSINKPIFLYGQSLGGNLSLNYALEKKPQLNGIISTSPWLKLVYEPKTLMILFARILRKLSPSLTRKAGLDINLLSHDPKVAEDYAKDKLNHQFITPNLFFGARKAGRKVIQNAVEIKIPVLLMHGTGDLITSFKASEKFAERLKNAGGDITFVPWENYYHEIHHEINNELVFQKIMNWIKEKSEK
ncbi:MAG: alpha/beta hydrolase [Bacteroidota bacterium]